MTGDGNNNFASHPPVCAKCGACVPVCPVFQVTGRESLAARGKLHLLAKTQKKPSATLADLLSRCLLCGACSAVCPRDLDPTGRFTSARGRASSRLTQLTAATLARPSITTAVAATTRHLGRLAGLLPGDSGLLLRLCGLGWEGDIPRTTYLASHTHFSETAQMDYFTGCLANALHPEIGHATEQLAAATGITLHAPKEQHCCGLAAMSAGNTDLARRLAQQNMAVFAAGRRPILTSCASCFHHLYNYPALFPRGSRAQQQALRFRDRLQDLTTFLHDREPRPPAPAQPGSRRRVYFHASCHLRHGPVSAQPARHVLQRLPQFELAAPWQGDLCCGHGGLFQLAHPATGKKIGAHLGQAIAAARVDIVITTCSGCLLQLKRLCSRHAPRVTVRHLAELLQEQMR